MTDNFLRLANVYRFRSHVAANVSGVGTPSPFTVYLEPGEARAIAAAMLACSADCDACGFVDSQFRTAVIEPGADAPADALRDAAPAMRDALLTVAGKLSALDDADTDDAEMHIRADMEKTVDAALALAGGDTVAPCPMSGQPDKLPATCPVCGQPKDAGCGNPTPGMVAQGMAAPGASPMVEMLEQGEAVKALFAGDTTARTQKPLGDGEMIGDLVAVLGMARDAMEAANWPDHAGTVLPIVNDAIVAGKARLICGPSSDALTALEGVEAFLIDCPATPHRDAVLRDVRAVLTGEGGTDAGQGGADAAAKLERIASRLRGEWGEPHDDLESDIASVIRGDEPFSLNPEAPDYEAMARAAGWGYAADSSGEKWWMRVPYDADSTSPFFETAKDVCEAPGFEPAEDDADAAGDDAGATALTTDDVGIYIRDMLGDGDIEAAGTVPDMPLPGCIPESEADSIDHVDASDPSNLRLHMASGARFVVRIIREG